MQHLDYAVEAATDECSQRYYLAATETRVADYGATVAWRTRITEARMLVGAIYGET